MIWVIIDVALGLLALVVLGLAGLSLWRHAKTLMHTISSTSARLGDATAALNTAQTRPTTPR